MNIKLEKVSLHLPSNLTKSKPRQTNQSISNKGLNFISRFQSNYFVALEDINLEISSGNRVAVIGHNGAGKSTLFRLLAGIYKPTKGSVNIPTYALPLLDKSIITNHMLTSIEACRAHYYYIRARYGKLPLSISSSSDFVESVLDFAELSDMRNTPIMHYSDGMRSRLVFALYTAINHPFIVIDESLGTADESFRTKAEKRLDEFIHSSSLVCIASHSIELLRKYCNQAILLESGRLIFAGTLEEVIKEYRG